MKIAILADTHFGVRGDSPVFLDYFSRFYREVFFPYVDEHKINTAIHLGDLVDRRKFLSFNTAEIMRREYIEPSIERGIDTHIITGNHDCFFKNHNRVNALREFVHGRKGFTIYDHPETTTILGKRFLMLPWISHENEEFSMSVIKASKADVCMAHLELIGFEMTKGQMMEHGMDPSLFKKFKAVYTGHYHHKSSKKNIHYLGAPYQMTWSDYDDPKGFHILDTDTMELEFIPNPLTLYTKVRISKDTKKVENLQGQFVKVSVDDDVDSKKLEKILKAAEIGVVDLQVVYATGEPQQEMQIEIVDDTMKILRDYIMSDPDIEVDKSALIGLMSELYNEAQH